VEGDGTLNCGVVLSFSRARQRMDGWVDGWLVGWMKWVGQRGFALLGCRTGGQGIRARNFALLSTSKA